MYFEELVKGKKWLWVADGPKNPITGKRRQISRRGKSKAEAKSRVEAAIEEAKQQFSFDPDIKVVDFSIIWFENYLLRGNKPNTNDYREFCLSLINKHIGQLPVKLVTSVKYQAILKIMQLVCCFDM
ncbi:hypothetical protein PGC35_06290 [Psychrobacillus sp. PGGUH221]|uniref:hypothetical protein n=1 Tax=Psychrobacillus sp. PGGUH221 TaxID=3020058 RepID=UPI0035C67BF9